MSDYQQNYSGFPIDPVPTGPESDAERTAYLPPVPPSPADETALLPPVPTVPQAPPAPAGQSRFGHIEAKYVTAESPQIPAATDSGETTAEYPSEYLHHLPQAGQAGQAGPVGPSAGHRPEAPTAEPSAWPAGWERPSAPPPTWAPAPAGQYPQPGMPTPQQPWPAHPTGHGGLAAPAEGFAPGQSGAGGVMAGQPQSGGGFMSGQPQSGGVGAVAPQAQAPGAGGSLREAFGAAQPTGPAGHGGFGTPAEGFAPAQPGAGGPAGGPVAGRPQFGGGFMSGQPQFGGVGAVAPQAQAPGAGGSLREAFGAAQPTGSAGHGGFGTPAEGFAPAQPGAGGPVPGQPQVGGPGGYPAPDVGYAHGQPQPGAYVGGGEQALGTQGGSLREAFASAEPTGPGRGAPEGVYVGEVLAPGQSPLEVGGGSLRDAFAGAQPTGPVTAPPVAAPAAPRTGSPIIDPGVQPGAVTLVLGALLGAAALAGKFGLVLPVALLQAVTAAGWFRLNGMWPARQGIALAALGGFVADAAILAASAHSSGPAIIAGTLGAFFLLVLILQIFRPSNPDERFYALTVCASATVVTVLAGAFLAVSSGKAVLAGALAAGVSAAVSAGLRKPPVIGFAAGGFLGLLVGGGLAAATGLGLTEGLLLGLGAGVCALIGRRVAAYDFPSRFVHMTAGVALPLAVAAPMVYLIAR